MADAYDPDTPEGAPSRTQYVTIKDIRVVLIGVPLLLAVLYPVWAKMRAEAEKTTCKANLSAISKAMQSYSQMNDSLMPPICVESPTGGPMIDSRGRSINWATLLHSHMSARHSFRCPSAQPNEVTPTQHSSDPKATIELSYGMVISMSTRSYDRIADPDDTILIAETINGGASGSYNPQPIVDQQGQKSPVDGFWIGYDDSNLEPSLKTRAMTRLAFRNNPQGRYGADLPGRHDIGIFYLTVSGRLGSLAPQGALVDRVRNELSGRWSTK